MQRVRLTALAPKQRAAVALPCGQRAAVEPGSCWAELRRGAEPHVPRAPLGKASRCKGLPCAVR